MGQIHDRTDKPTSGPSGKWANGTPHDTNLLLGVTTMIVPDRDGVLVVDAWKDGVDVSIPCKAALPVPGRFIRVKTTSTSGMTFAYCY